MASVGKQLYKYGHHFCNELRLLCPKVGSVYCIYIAIFLCSVLMNQGSHHGDM